VQRPFFPGQRWLNIGLRSLHLLGVAGMGAEFLIPGAADDAWHIYGIMTVATGVGMMLLDLRSDPHWFDQTYGQAVILKLVLLGLMPVVPSAAPLLFATVILLSALFSHAPARVRHYSLRLGRPVERR
jgi:hypothetical protein